MMTNEGQEIINICNKFMSPMWGNELRNQQQEVNFINNLCNLYFTIKAEVEKHMVTDQMDEVRIIFIAHGDICGLPMIPGSSLMNSSTIRDVVLYPPWNCAIDSIVVLGIATGCIIPHHREFENCNHPANLPNDWNRASNALLQLMPQIIVTPVMQNEQILMTLNGFAAYFNVTLPPRTIIIPYTVPAGNMQFFQQIPFQVLTAVIGLVGLVLGHETVIHLAACLSPENMLLQTTQ
nr:PREDICTED: uncharacterized protein LOC106706685 [Latimeria chalumnae]|eukprot:XP_014353453.1 PREDICTED: uncharacterized protein LOC106706685 [Latimeria chalumnae]